MNQVIVEFQGQRIVAGLNAITGDEGSGKTQFLKQLSAHHADALWLDLKLPEHDQSKPEEVWALLKINFPQWSESLCKELCLVLGLHEHLDKKLYMLSTGSRRKVGIIALLASGAKFTCLDQPFVALDQASISVLCDFLNDMSEQHARAWLVADYEADPRIEWRHVIKLGLN